MAHFLQHQTTTAAPPSSAELKHHDLPIVFIVWEIHLTKFTLTLNIYRMKLAARSANLPIYHFIDVRARALARDVHSPSVKNLFIGKFHISFVLNRCWVIERGILVIWVWVLSMSAFCIYIFDARSIAGCLTVHFKK